MYIPRGFYFKEYMKLLVTFLLVLTSNASEGMGRLNAYEFFSSVCKDNRYIKGTKLEMPNGQVKWRCLKKSDLPVVYEADVNVKCSSTHTVSAWVFSSNHLHYKLCILTKDLGRDYYTFGNEKCTRGYSSNQEIVYTDVLFDHKLCERDS